MQRRAPRLSVFVIDASVAVSAAISPSGVPRQAIFAARTRGQIGLSLAVFKEIASVLTRPKFARLITAEQRYGVEDLLVSAAIWCEPDVTVNDCRDPKDNIYLDLALAVQASTIVSGDDDLLVLHPWRGVPILKPADFLVSLRPGQE